MLDKSVYNQIQKLIYIVRGKQVMLDSDLAILYQVENKYLIRQMKRNIDRFPEDFCFQLTKEEDLNLRCQIVTSRLETNHGGRRYSPYVFTEQGISMLSSVLRSEIATKVNINIMRYFVEMRRLFVNNRELFSRLDKVELKQLETDKKIEEVFNYIAKSKEVTQKIFFDGQIYDSFSLLVKIIKQANKSIVLIDNYVDIDTLNILCKRKSGVKIDIFTYRKSRLSHNDIEKFNLQYKNLSVKNINSFHDRFLILDNTICYLIGASLKDAGKKSFGISKVEDKKVISDILDRLK